MWEKDRNCDPDKGADHEWGSWWDHGILETTSGSGDRLFKQEE
jgi:hypothetical protein